MRGHAVAVVLALALLVGCAHGPAMSSVGNAQTEAVNSLGGATVCLVWEWWKPAHEGAAPWPWVARPFLALTCPARRGLEFAWNFLAIGTARFFTNADHPAAIQARPTWVRAWSIERPKR